MVQGYRSKDYGNRGESNRTWNLKWTLALWQGCVVVVMRILCSLVHGKFYLPCDYSIG